MLSACGPVAAGRHPFLEAPQGTGPRTVSPKLQPHGLCRAQDTARPQPGAAVRTRPGRRGPAAWAAAAGRKRGHRRETHRPSSWRRHRPEAGDINGQQWGGACCGAGPGCFNVKDGKHWLGSCGGSHGPAPQESALRPHPPRVPHVCHTGAREGTLRMPPPASVPSPRAYVSTETLGCFSPPVSWESHAHDSLVFWGHRFELERAVQGLTGWGLSWCHAG